MTPCNRFFGQRVRPCAAADEGRMANTLSGPAACCRFTSSWWRPVCLDRAQRGTVAACHNRTRSVFDRTLRNRAHVSRSRACGPAPVYEPCPDRRARERRVRPQAAGSRPHPAAAPGPGRPALVEQHHGDISVSATRLHDPSLAFTPAEAEGRPSLASGLTRTGRPPMRVPEFRWLCDAVLP